MKLVVIMSVVNRVGGSPPVNSCHIVRLYHRNNLVFMCDFLTVVL